MVGSVSSLLGGGGGGGGVVPVSQLHVSYECSSRENILCAESGTGGDPCEEDANGGGVTTIMEDVRLCVENGWS